MPKKNGGRKTDAERLVYFCDKHQEDHQKLHAAVAEQHVRMAELKEDVLSLRPGRGDKWVYWTLIFMILTSLIGSIWFISERILERPTTKEVQQVVSPLQDKLDKLGKESTEHDIILHDMRDDMKEIKGDLKDIKSK